jgi:low temperature requirement protein LtrA
MAADNPRGAMFRVLVPDRQARVTNAELFFDLVFVFAVTQLSHTLLHHFTPLGAVQVTLLFLAVWWVWVYTTWVTNWLDPEQMPVRILLFLLMLGGLVLSMSIPKAFEERGLWFAGAYAAMQIGRTTFWLLATPKHRTPVRHNAIRILVWLCCSAVFWILGGLAEGETRLYLWIAALAIEYVSAAVRFWTPRLGFSSVEAWAVEGSHMAERCAGFIIIALGPRMLPPSCPRWSAASRCGGSISTGVPRPAPKSFRSRPNPGVWRASPTPTCTCRSSAASSLPPSLTSSC